VRKIAQSILFLAVIGVATPPRAWPASPCDCVDRSLTQKTKVAWALAIARQLHVARVDLLESFRSGGWTIAYVDPREADEVFLFYSHDPLHSSYITMWSGAARSDEEQSIRAWTLENAPRIPQKLASCFAWYVTTGRGRADARRSRASLAWHGLSLDREAQGFALRQPGFRGHRAPAHVGAGLALPVLICNARSVQSASPLHATRGRQAVPLHPASRGASRADPRGE